MSRFSGVCDFCDTIEIFGLDYILNSKVYIGDSEEPLKLTCLKDCIPYYPYVVGSASYNNVKRTAVIRLSRISEIERKSEYNPEGADYYRELLQEEMNKYSE